MKLRYLVAQAKQGGLAIDKQAGEQIAGVNAGAGQAIGGYLTPE